MTEMYKIVLSIFIGLLFLPWQVLAQSVPGGNYQDDLAEEGQKLQVSIAALRKYISEKGSPLIKQIDGRVQFKVDAEEYPNAWTAVEKDGSRSIGISATFRLLVTYLADMVIIGRIDSKFLPCQQSYKVRLFELLSNNQSAIQLGKSPNRLLAPEKFLGVVAGPCSKYAEQFPIAVRHRLARDTLVNDIIFMIYLHELGHIAQDHRRINFSSLESIVSRQERQLTHLKLLQRSRENEFEADNWAADQWVSLMPNPMAIFMDGLSMTVFLALASFGCDEGSTHPNGYQRFVTQMSRIRDKAMLLGKAVPYAEGDKLLADLNLLAMSIPKRMQCKWSAQQK